MLVRAGEYWCPDCGERRAKNYQEVAEKCGQRGRQTWLCPECASDLVEIERAPVFCPFCKTPLSWSTPINSREIEAKCQKHGRVVIHQ